MMHGKNGKNTNVVFVSIHCMDEMEVFYLFVTSKECFFLLYIPVIVSINSYPICQPTFLGFDGAILFSKTSPTLGKHSVTQFEVMNAGVHCWKFCDRKFDQTRKLIFRSIWYQMIRNK